jgi:hypothetical protein
MFLSNLPLGERIARAAYELGGGVQEAELLSRALLWQGHPAAERSHRRSGPLPNRYR